NAITSWIVEQFGFAMMRRRAWSASACAFTSGTTSGTSASLRQRELLSITMQPAAAAFGAYSPDASAPAENSASCARDQSNDAASRTVTARPRNRRDSPSDASVASRYNSPTGTDDSARMSIIVSPMSPVAPRMAMSNFRSVIVLSVLEKIAAQERRYHDASITVPRGDPPDEHQAGGRGRDRDAPDRHRRDRVPDLPGEVAAERGAGAEG